MSEIRNFIGYGNNPPKFKWVNNSKMAVQFVLNYEEINMKKIRDFTLNDDGRCDTPILENDQFNIGKYEIKFFCGEYFRKFTKLNEIPFLDDVVIRFGISDKNEHYHVPLLISPWSYTTYRGS